jgi:NitT/TauT family transport system substrate-binding protein
MSRSQALLSYRPSRRQFLGALALGATAPWWLSACSSDDESGGGGEFTGTVLDATFLSVIPVASLTNSPELLADAGGYFKKRGLNVTLEATQGTPPAIQTIIAGSALIAKFTDIDTMSAIADKDAPLVNVGAVEKKGLVRFMSSKRRPMTRPEDFRGATVGVPSVGGTSDKLMDLVLASAGIPKDTVKRQVVGVAPGVFELVKSGRVDAYAVSLDTSLTLLKQDSDAVLFAPSTVVSAGVQSYTTSKDQLADPARQDALRRYLQAVTETIRFIIDDEKNNFAETIRIISTKYDVPSLQDTGVAIDALKTYTASWATDGVDKVARTMPQKWQASYDEMVRSGLLKPGLDPSKWMNDTFAPNAG